MFRLLGWLFGFGVFCALAGIAVAVWTLPALSPRFDSTVSFSSHRARVQTVHSYDDRGQLNQAVAPGGSSYSYDDQGQLISAEESSA